MSVGHIKFFNERKDLPEEEREGRRWGIIIPEGAGPHERSKHVFFYEDVLQATKSVVAGAEVEYEVIPNFPAKKAMSVKVLGRSYAAD
jgi:hypothetical protein